MTLYGVRDWRVPPEAGTFHAIGDTHITPTGIFGSTTVTTHVAHDLNSGMVPDVPHLFTGDLTDTGASSEDSYFLNWMTTIPGEKRFAVGNHDVNLSNNTRTPAQWAAAYGMPGKNYTWDVLPGLLRIIVVGFDAMNDGASFIRLSDATLAYIDAQATAAGSLACAVACHAPIWDTVHGTALQDTSSTDDGFWVIGGSSAPSSEHSANVVDVLEAHSNIKAWISGHTHSRIEVPDIVSGVVAGSHKVAHINTSSVKPPGLSSGGYAAKWTPVRSPYITFLGDAFEVRWRDHYAKRWTHPWKDPSRRVMSVTGL